MNEITQQQKSLIEANKLNHTNWVVIIETPKNLVIRNKYTLQIKTISK